MNGDKAYLSNDKYMAYRMGNLSQKDYVEYKMCKENRLE